MLETFDNSDGSFSTEVDATLSHTISGSDIDHDDVLDNQSIMSDLLSANGKSIKLKKFTNLINKLKNENAMLRDLLEKANAVDIATLRTKLRGSNADLSKLRQHNAELKDRVQTLEAKLFHAHTHNERIPTRPKLLSELDKSDEMAGAEKGVVEVRVSDDVVPAIQSDRQTRANVKALQSRCNHLTRLSQSFEVTIEALHKEITALKQNAGSQSVSSGKAQVKNQVMSKLSSPLSETDRAAADRKTIQELANEVRRLTRMLPDSAEPDTIEAAVEEAILPDDRLKVPRVAAAHGKPALQSVTQTKPTTAQTPPASALSVTHLILSFALGLAVMLLCSLRVSAS